MKKDSLLQIRYINGLRFVRALAAGCREVIANEQDLNRINVFPIPDKDTGSNLKRTIQPILEDIPVEEPSIGECSRRIADAAVASAMGYSGIIFSQFLSGFAEGAANQKRISVEEFVRAAAQGTAKAYNSLDTPVEGTLLSVLKAWSDEVKILSGDSDDIAVLLKESLIKAQAALQKTIEQLDVLRKHKVVDAGGKAFVCFLEGIVDYIEKGRLESALAQRQKRQHKDKEVGKKGEVRFCAECCVHGQSLDIEELAKKLSALGQDLIFYGSLNFAKIHIRTDDPGEIFSCASEFGSLSAKKIFQFVPDQPAGEKLSLALVSDTTCDLSDDCVESHSIYFVPIKIQVMDRVFTDRQTIIPERFYELMAASPSLPKTSQPGLLDFQKAFTHLLAHYRTLLSVQLSGRLSGTFQTAAQAARSVDANRITVIDSRTTSVGLGLVAMEGLRALKEGLDIHEVVSRVNMAINNGEIFVGIPTLKYLVQGGRVSKAKGLIGKLLNINPILTINREGALEPIGKTRGQKKLEQKILEIAAEKLRKAKENLSGNGQSKGQKEAFSFSVAVVHSNAPQLGNRVAEKIKILLGIEAAMVMNACPGLGAHIGPGAVAVAILRISP